jgi:hypothetical protein
MIPFGFVGHLRNDTLRHTRGTQRAWQAKAGIQALNLGREVSLARQTAIAVASSAGRAEPFRSQFMGLSVRLRRR